MDQAPTPTQCRGLLACLLPCPLKHTHTTTARGSGFVGCAGSVARIAGDVISPQEYVDTFARLTGKQVRGPWSTPPHSMPTHRGPFKGPHMLRIASQEAAASPRDGIDGCRGNLPIVCLPNAPQATYEQFSLDFFRRLPIPGAELIVQMYECEWPQTSTPCTHIIAQLAAHKHAHAQA
jgi:hypothetical protein